MICCNKCGKCFEENELTDLTEIEISFNYGSKFDLEKWTFYLCDNCIEEMIKEFKIEPKKELMIF